MSETKLLRCDEVDDGIGECCPACHEGGFEMVRDMTIDGRPYDLCCLKFARASQLGLLGPRAAKGR